MSNVVHELEKQVEYWRSFAAYLASCHAATAEYDGTLKGVSRARKARFGDICLAASLGLSGRWHKKYHSDGDVQDAIDRCNRAMKTMDHSSTREERK